MAFKSMTAYNDERYSGLFLLRNDGDSEEVIPLYQSVNDVMVVDAHYMKSDSYTGYVQCLGNKICPACEQNIRIQTKLFIPLYVISTGEILFWDRNTRMYQQLENDIFSKFANPSEFVFRITRHGASGDINTRYEIVAVAKNNILSFDDILKSKSIVFPDYYNTVCVDWSVEDYRSHMIPVSTQVDIDEMPEYKISPRVESVESSLPDVSDSFDEGDIASEVVF